MITQVEVTKNKNETTSSLMRRFSKKIASSSILKKAKKIRYKKRKFSDFTKKKKALKRIVKQKEIARLKKLGKIEDGAHRKYR